MNQRTFTILIFIKLAIAEPFNLNKFVIELSRPDSGLNMGTDEHYVSLDAQGLTIPEDD